MIKKLVLFLVLALAPVFLRAEVTLDEVRSQVPGRGSVLPPEAQPSLSDLAVTFTWLKAVGLNPEGLGLKDFDYVAVAVFSTAAPGIPVFHQIQVVFKSKASGRLQTHSLAYMDKYGTYPTAVALTQITKKEPE